MSQFFKETSVYKIDHEKYSQNYDHIFGNKEKKEEVASGCDETIAKEFNSWIYNIDHDFSVSHLPIVKMAFKAGFTAAVDRIDDESMIERCF